MSCILSVISWITSHQSFVVGIHGPGIRQLILAENCDNGTNGALCLFNIGIKSQFLAKLFLEREQSSNIA